jgi:predicted DCC family thiol-disulfide oxidoreductase YuxK
MIDLRTIDHPVILFDGVCNLCNGSVQFIIKRDPAHQFRFASFQSEFGQHVLQQFNLAMTEFDSIILLEKGIVYTKSNAALRVVKKLTGAWSALYAFMIVPQFIRNAVYDLAARNRYKWFGKKEACWIPTRELKDLFIDQ